MIAVSTGLVMACTHSGGMHSVVAQKLSFLRDSSCIPIASQLMEAKASSARSRQDVDDVGATVDKQLSLAEKHLRALMPELLSAMYLVGRHAGEDRRVEMESIMAAHRRIPHRTGCDMENQEIDWNRMGFYLKMILERVDSTLTNVHTLQNVLGNKYVENMTKDPKSLLRLAKKKEPRRQKLIYVIKEKEKRKSRG